MLFRIFTVVAVLALAVSTWILSSPARRSAPVVDPKHPDLPGYYLKNAVLTDFDLSGAPGVRIEAERIDQIPQSNEIALYNVKVDYQPPSGQQWTMVGDMAHVQPGGKVIDVSGNVKLQGTPVAHEMVPVIRTETLRYDVPDGIASTQSDVRVEFGAHTLTARGLSANLKDRTLRLESKVNGRIHP